mmetsp:Transcript_67798/g.163927  ORF Transcript_67798/g.163927 Transcript_67798/m.163927 type:complete len:113 (+) Transcript_67798:488-826(+)
MHGAWPACLSPSLSGGTAPPTEAALAPTAAELDYLPEFLERHAAPETVTVEMADAELRARRAAKAKQAGRLQYLQSGAAFGHGAIACCKAACRARAATYRAMHRRAGCTPPA